jgi:iron complex transport system ATP-binding protein
MNERSGQGRPQRSRGPVGLPCSVLVLGAGLTVDVEWFMMRAPAHPLFKSPPFLNEAVKYASAIGRCMAGTPIIEMYKVSITKGCSTVLRDVDLRIDQGERIAILGPNGSGKSSLIKTMTGENRCDTSVDGAYVRIRGEENWDLFDVRRAFGVVSGELQYTFTRDMDGLEAVLSGFFGSVGTNRSQGIDGEMEQRAMSALALVRSEHLAQRKVHTLSMGESRRVLMARALVNGPEALILDEPMTSLDLTGKFLVREAIGSLAQSGRTTVLVTHDPSDLIPATERIIMMKDGRVFSDGGMDTLTEEKLSRLFDVPVRLAKIDGRYFAWS